MAVYNTIITFGKSTEYLTFSNVRQRGVNGRSIFCLLCLSTPESVDGIKAHQKRKNF